MIKIDQGNYTKSLSQNPEILNETYRNNQLGLTWECGHSYLSFVSINGLIDKLHRRTDIDFLLVVVSRNVFSNLLSDMAAMRMYQKEQTATLSMSEDIQFNTSYVPCIITIDDKLDKNAYLLEVINKNILNTKTTITINDEIEITSNVDKSKEKLKIVGLHKFCNIEAL